MCFALCNAGCLQSLALLLMTALATAVKIAATASRPMLVHGLQSATPGTSHAESEGRPLASPKAADPTTCLTNTPQSDTCLVLQPVKKAKKNDGAAAPKAAAKSEVDTSATNGSKTVFCKNLPWGATDEDLSGFFADCGDVTDCRIGMLLAYTLFILICGVLILSLYLCHLHEQLV